MPGLVDRLERVVRTHILNAMPFEGRTELEALDLRSLVTEYQTWRGRFVPPQPRAVHWSRELLAQSAKLQEHRQALDALVAKIERGDDLTGHLSDRVHQPSGNVAAPLEYRTDRDLLLADWGIHHLHFSAKRGHDDVLFVAFTGDSAYLIGIRRHPKHDNWAAEDIFAVIVRNWPKAGLVHELHGLLPTQTHSDEERRELRAAAVNMMMEIDGKGYAPGPLGMTLAGTSLQSARAAMKLMAELQAWRKADADEWLRQQEGVSPGAYWQPIVYEVRPGFEEYCGFVAEDVFVRVGRIC